MDDPPARVAAGSDRAHAFVERIELSRIATAIDGPQGRVVYLQGFAGVGGEGEVGCLVAGPQPYGLAGRGNCHT